MSSLADILAIGKIIKFEGKEYTLRPPNLDEQGQFSRWLEQNAHDAVDRDVRPQVTQEDRDRRHGIIDVNAGLGMYEWDGPLAIKALWTPKGLAKILQIVCHGQNVSAELAENLVREQLKRIAAIMLIRAADDPKAIAPALEALGIPTEWLLSEQSETSSSNSSTHPSTESSSTSEPTSTNNSSSFTPSGATP